MPRTFSLWRLVMFVTLCGVLCGIAVNFPEVSFDVSLVVAMLLGYFVPAILVGGSLALFSSRRLIAFAGALVGALFFALLPIAACVLVDPGRWHEYYFDSYLVGAIPAAIGAMIVGIAAIIADPWWRKTPDDSSSSEGGSKH